MALLDRFDVTAAAQNGVERIPSHQFTDTLFFWAIGQAGISRASVIAQWSLTVSPVVDPDEDQLDAMQANYVAASTLADKQEYIHRVESGLRLLEAGILTVAQAGTFMSV